MPLAFDLISTLVIGVTLPVATTLLARSPCSTLASLVGSILVPPRVAATATITNARTATETIEMMIQRFFFFLLRHIVQGESREEIRQYSNLGPAPVQQEPATWPCDVRRMGCFRILRHECARFRSTRRRLYVQVPAVSAVFTGSIGIHCPKSLLDHNRTYEPEHGNWWAGAGTRIP